MLQKMISVLSFRSQKNARILLALALPFTFGLPSASASAASAQGICGEDVKVEVAKALGEIANKSKSEKLALEAKLYEKYKFCAEEGEDVAKESGLFEAARQCGAKVSNLGSTSFEEMSCCGYDPQRRQFGCPVKVKQSFGFGSSPLPGSREYVLHCVAGATGNLVPVGKDSVHLANEMHGQNPSWQFAVIAAANDNLDTI